MKGESKGTRAERRELKGESKEQELREEK